MTEQHWTRQRGDCRRVVVVGAGVAGMTAAHELVERGYEVEVVEASSAPYDAREPRIGGMARTTWARVPSPPDQVPLGLVRGSKQPDARAQRSSAGMRIEPDRAPLPIAVSLDPVVLGKPAKSPFASALPAITAFAGALSEADAVLVIASRELTLDERARLKELLGDRAMQVTVAKPAEGERAYMQISVAGARVPGEHGFRFFPSFYHHLFDTMKRIPIPEAAIRDPAAAMVDAAVVTADSSRTVFDALRSAEVIQLGLEPDRRGARSFEIPRRPMRSIEDLRALFASTLERAGYRGQDLYRLVTRYVEYLTSAPERRVRYEAISWADFLGLDDGGFSSVFANHVRSGAQALVAMTSRTNDARTIGSIAMQLTLDQVRANPGGYTDATLRGPTSLELFEPWRAYLESESVQFTCAELVGFTGNGMAVQPVFGFRERPDQPFEVAEIAPADYYVITIPVDKFQGLFTADKPIAQWRDPGRAPGLIDAVALRAANRACRELDQLERDEPADPPGESGDDVVKYLDFPIGKVAAAPDKGPLRYMCGIQFYFEADVKMILGHTLCLDSPWGVSHISQAQYWQDRSRGQSGVRGVISAIFTRFEVKAPDRTGERPLTVLECNPDQLAERVWKQIADAWDAERYGALPEPDYYGIDESLHHDGTAWRNDTPYLVNHVGAWPTRGGLRTSGGDYTYRVQLGHTVFAGAFMRTTTRLNTMEAANESGRRATNAILAHDRNAQQGARLWNLEDHELPEAGPLRDLDRRIAARGGHHILRHAGVEAALRAMPWDLVRLVLPAQGEDR